MTLAEIIKSGDLDQYRPKPPRANWDIDATVCETARCSRCGHLGLVYRPFTNPRSYRAFSVCPACDWCEEF